MTDLMDASNFSSFRIDRSSPEDFLGIQLTTSLIFSVFKLLQNNSSEKVGWCNELFAIFKENSADLVENQMANEILKNVIRDILNEIFSQFLNEIKNKIIEIKWLENKNKSTVNFSELDFIVHKFFKTLIKNISLIYSNQP